MYILSNGVKITEKTHQCLCEAIKDMTKKRIYFLDINNGKLVCIPRIYRRKLETLQKEPQRFILLPEISEKELRERFTTFNEEMVDIPKLQARLRKEIKKKTSIDKLEKILEKDPSGWIHGWCQNEQFLLAERIEEWITQPPLNARDDPDYWFDDNCPICQLERKRQEEGNFPTLKELKEAFERAKNQGAFVGGELFGDSKKERKWMEERGFKYIGTADDFKMPKWMECTWRRVPCGRDDCPICGRIKKDRQRHIEKGENPDDPKFALDDVSQSFKEVLQIIKKDAESKGFNITNIENIKEPPEPKELSLYGEVEKWNRSVMALGDMAQVLGEFWIHTEAAADLFWYANILMAKTYRQLCNRWHINNGDDYGEFDRQYTSYVLKECLEILKKLLKGLADSYPQKQELNSLYSNLLKLERKIIKI